MQIELYGRIYKLTNKHNNKSYVGQSIEININKRWNVYKNILCKSQPKIYNALKKYGPESFLFEIIDESATDQSQLDSLETMYIIKFDCVKNGYNCDYGGRGHGRRSAETSKKHRETLLIKRLNRHKTRYNWLPQSHEDYITIHASL